MSVFKKTFHDNGQEPVNDGAVAAAKIEFTRRMIFSSMVLILACLAIFAYITKAWFANNKDVSAENASVVSESGTSNLFIRFAEDNKKEYYSYLKKDWSIADPDGPTLFPISTADCKDWYYVSSWALDYDDSKAATNGITTGQYYASGYTKATVDEKGLYSVTLGEKPTTYRAYYCCEYNLYTDQGNLDVYLNPTKPIEIDCGADTANEGLLNAIRVAIVDSTEPPKLVFVYAPVDESGTGMNYIAYDTATSTGTKAVADTFYAVTGPNVAAEQTVLVGNSGLANYTGKAVDGDPHSFTAGTNSICTADTDGTDLGIYVWLEGMDAQSVINVADGRTINVKLNFVGVAP